MKELKLIGLDEYETLKAEREILVQLYMEDEAESREHVEAIVAARMEEKKQWAKTKT